MNDNLPQAACTDCLDKLNTCLNTLDNFRDAQKQHRKNYDYN